MLEHGFKSHLGLEYYGFSMWHYLKLIRLLGDKKKKKLATGIVTDQCCIKDKLFFFFPVSIVGVCPGSWTAVCPFCVGKTLTVDKSMVSLQITI